MDTEKINVLITASSDREESAKNWKRLLAFETDIVSVVLLEETSTPNPVQQSAISAGFIPDVIVVTHDGVNQAWIRKLMDRFPLAATVVIVYRTTEDVFNRLKLLGVRECLSFPLPLEEMVAIIRALYSRTH